MRCPDPLPNLGQTCFLNATLQLLRRWGYPAHPPQQLVRTLGLARGRQHDAHEALLLLLARAPDFGGPPGRLLSVVQCGATHETSTVAEPFHVLSLPMADTIEAALGHAAQELRGADVWRSPGAARQGITPVRSTQRLELAQLPPQGVVLHWKRFDNRGRKRREAVQALQQWRGYALAAAVLHHGTSASSGHYTAVVRAADEQWFRCDDAHVAALGRQRPAELSQAYLLLYLPGQ